jgi:hypothetical protein
MTAMKDAK